MRFLRHLGAATAIVALVVVLGLAWAHFWPQTLVQGPQVQFRQEIVTARPGGGIAGGPNGATANYARPFDLGLGSMFQSVNLPVFRHTVVIEAGVIAAVVFLDVLRRRSRRAWRAAQLSAETYRPDDEP